VDAEINVAMQQNEKAKSISSASAQQMNVFYYAGAREDATDQNCIHQNVCNFPGLLTEARCYTDASISPDDSTSTTKKPGLRIFILDPTGPSKFFIKAQVSHVNCVLMAEAAGMALAAMIASGLNIRNLSFLTDNQQLAAYFSFSDLSSPPRWDRPFTQRFLNAMASSSYRVLKVHRSFNATAHLLAHQAFRASESQCNLPNVTCSNVANMNSCPLREVLHLVNGDPFSPIAPYCC